MRRRWEREFLRNEAIAAAVAAVVFAFASEIVLGPEKLSHYLEQQRFAVFPQLAALSGALLGLVIAAAAVVLDRISEGRLPLLQRSKQAPKLSAVFVSAMRWLGVATVLAMLMLIPTSDIVDRVFVYVWMFAALMVVVRLSRTIWIVGYLMKIVSTQSASTTHPK